MKSVSREMYEQIHYKMYNWSHNKTVKHLSERIYHQVRGTLFAELWFKIHNQVYGNILIQIRSR
jgi:hypothetical protein